MNFIIEIYIYINQTEHLRYFINRIFGQLKNNSYVFAINKTAQNGISRKPQTQKMRPYEHIETPKLVAYTLEDFHRHQLFVTEVTKSSIFSKNCACRNKWGKLWITLI